MIVTTLLQFMFACIGVQLFKVHGSAGLASNSSTGQRCRSLLVCLRLVVQVFKVHVYVGLRETDALVVQIFKVHLSAGVPGTGGPGF